jgi:hypothetical protein
LAAELFGVLSPKTQMRPVMLSPCPMKEVFVKLTANGAQPESMLVVKSAAVSALEIVN